LLGWTLVRTQHPLDFFTKINWKSREGIIKTVGTNLISFEKWTQKTQKKKPFFKLVILLINGIRNILEEEEVEFFILPLSIYTIFATIFLAKILPLHSKKALNQN